MLVDEGLLLLLLLFLFLLLLVDGELLLLGVRVVLEGGLLMVLEGSWRCWLDRGSRLHAPFLDDLEGW